MTKFKRIVAVFLVALMVTGIFMPARKAQAAAPLLLVPAYFAVEQGIQWLTVAAMGLWAAGEAYDLQEKLRYSD